LGAVGKVKVSAEASWLGQSGAAALKQRRDFEFSIVVAHEGPVTERVLGEAAALPSTYPQNDLFSNFTGVMGDSLPAFAAGALALLGIMRVAGRVSKNKGGKE
jgi:hypothetical protein